MKKSVGGSASDPPLLRGPKNFFEVQTFSKFLPMDCDEYRHGKVWKMTITLTSLFKEDISTDQSYLAVSGDG